MNEDEFQLLYGLWQSFSPGEVASLMAGCGFRWWVAGGWALQTAGAEPRPHGDTDVAVLHRDLDLVRAWLSDFHLWEAHEGTLRPLLPGEEMTAEREQLWMRTDAYGPWLLDLVFSPSQGEEWVYKRHHQIRLPIDRVGWVSGGVSYVRPEIVLLFKAKARRPKDDLDFVSILPRLAPVARDWLLGSLHLSEPDSPWVTELEKLG